MKPRVFIGSSTEGLTVAHAIQANIERFSEPTVWTQGVFPPSASSVESLLRMLDKVDSGILVFLPDDILHLRDQEYRVARDNVILEFGMLLGRLGRDRSFLIIPRDVQGFHLPSDLVGLTPLTYDQNRQDQNYRAALGPACTEIEQALAKLIQAGAIPRSEAGSPGAESAPPSLALDEPTFVLASEFVYHHTRIDAIIRGISGYHANAHYVACRIGNTGKLAAKQVEASVTSVRRVLEGGKLETYRLLAPLNLSWTHYENRALAQIPGESERLLTLGHTTDPEKGGEIGEPGDSQGLSRFCLELFVRPNSQEHLLPKGEYEIDVQISATNAISSTFTLHLSHTGKWSPNPEEMYGKELRMELVHPGS